MNSWSIFQRLMVAGIAVTAHPSFDSRRDAERAGYGAVFSKPFPREELKDAILALTRTTATRPD